MRLKKAIVTETNVKPNSIYFWSDSRTVIKYICNESSHFPPYIMHKVNKIQRHSNIENWSYIKTNDNIVDYCTQPWNMGHHSNQKQFLIGTEILYQKELAKSSYMDFPTRNQQIDNLTLNQRVAHANVAINQPIDKIINWDSYSSWNKLVKHIAWIIKLKTKWVNKKRCIIRTTNFPYLLPKDLNL